jgi:hypothetical protein
VIAAALALYGVTHNPPGLQGDEAFFLVALRHPETTAYSIEAPGIGRVSLMVNSYVGAIKAAIMGAIFHFAGPSILVLRVFGIAALALSGVLFFRLARNWAPVPLALACTAALLFDPAYATTAVLDWGPVALQHVFLLSALIALERAVKLGNSRWALLAGAAAGLGVWDKALFVFPLLAVLAALLTLSVFSGRWRDWRLALPALGGFVIGAAPFLLSVIDRSHGAAIGELARLDLSHFSIKAAQMIRTMDGTVLLGFVAHLDGTPPSLLTGSRTFLPLLCAVSAVALFPVLNRRYGQFALATLVGSVAGWLALALVRDVGFSAHHTILLWPAPYLFALFTALAWMERRPPLAPLFVAILAVVSIQNSRALIHLWRTAMSHGYTANWTDAQYPLASALIGDAGPEKTILVGDWGLLEPIYLATGGRQELRMVTDVYWKGGFEQEDLDEIAARMSGARQVAIVFRTPDDSFYPHVRPAVEEVAQTTGLSLAFTRVIADRLGVPRYDIVIYRRP